MKAVSLIFVCGRGLGAWFLLACLVPLVQAQQRPYIGYAYPAGGRLGATVQVRVGGQGITEVDTAFASVPGVKVRVLELRPRLGNQEQTLLQEQLKELRTGKDAPAVSMAQPMDVEVSGAVGGAATMMMTSAEQQAEAKETLELKQAELRQEQETKALVARIEERVADFVQEPACMSISNLVLLEVEISADAPVGDCELRLATTKGVSNPLRFQIGTIREYTQKALGTSPKQVLGKEAQALRKRGPKDGDLEVELPCTVNGQLGPGEVNRFRFRACKGEELVLSAHCRHLIPYIADAVPGWFHAVLVLRDERGREVAFNDPSNFKPDPVVRFTVPADGDYTLDIHDSIYRGREDFIYRVTLGGAKEAEAVPRVPEPRLAGLPSVEEQPCHDSADTAQPLQGTVLVEGLIENPKDTDWYKIEGKEGEELVVEVLARRLDSPLDSFVTVTDAEGKLIALNDDSQDLGDGVNTHHADSYLQVKLPATGTYYIQVADRARKGGPGYFYRLRVGAPLPDFALRVVPSSLAVRIGGGGQATVYLLRKDNYEGPVTLRLENPPPGFAAQPVTIQKGQSVGKLNIRVAGGHPRELVSLKLVGVAQISGKTVVREAVAAEDRMQAFLWRHLVPAQAFVVSAFDPNYTLPLKRPFPVAPAKPEAPPAAEASVATVEPATMVQSSVMSGEMPGPTAASATQPTAAPVEPPKPKFTKQQVAGRLRQLRTLYEAGLLTDSFYLRKVEECDQAQ